MGLDHSKSRSSVMYPVTHGKTQLSNGDIASLKLIYQ
ncbi:matrixin family metalloprotease [Levilactobacillus brevis]|nr:matrixin family metalloprotease [Levilactobacillus brevis]